MMRKNLAKGVSMVLIASLLTGCAGGGEPVVVTPVSYISGGGMDEAFPTSGIITSTAKQEVYLTDDQLVTETYVKPGDRVKIGDKLLAMDTTLLELDLEMEVLTGQSIDMEIEDAKKELQKLQGTTPVSDSASAASLVEKTQNMVSTGINETEPLTEPTPPTEPETEPVTETETEPETEPVTETESETEAPTETEPQQTEPTETESTEPEPPKKEIKPYKELDFKTEAHEGEGTEEKPYIFYCKEGAEIDASFMNKLLGFNAKGDSRKKGGMERDGKGCYAILKLKDKPVKKGPKPLITEICINGTARAKHGYAEGTKWTFTGEGLEKELPPEVPDDEDMPDDEIFDDGWGDWGGDYYTAEELQAAIKELKSDIANLELDKKESELKVKEAERKLEEAHVVSSLNGVVKSVGDPALGQMDGEPFLVVASDEGLYVKGTISEMQLGEVSVGTTMQGMSYESGMSFEATITEISPYPTNNNMGYYDGNSNASYYPFMAYIEMSDGLSNNEYVELTIQSDVMEESSGIYIEKSYVREENGQHYVFIRGKDKKLVKQYVTTGKTLYSYYIEIKEGLTMEDYIAFPYGKNVKNGAKTTTSDEAEGLDDGGEILEDGMDEEDGDSYFEDDDSYFEDDDVEDVGVEDLDMEVDEMGAEPMVME